MGSGIKSGFRRVWDRGVHILTSPWRAFRALCYVTGFFVIASTFAGTGWALWFYHSLPKIERKSFADFRREAQTALSRRLPKGERMGEWVPIDRVNRDLIYAVVMAEDGQFFEHDGIDLDAMLDAFARNIRKRKVVAGGSTLSQQVTKNVYLTNERSTTRKLKELILTWKIEKKFTKNQILEVYLNIAELGPGLYGVAEATKYYFGKAPSKMNAAEGAWLAILLPSPRKYHYIMFQNRNITPDKKSKMKRILQDMAHNDYISAEQYSRYRRWSPLKHLRRYNGRGVAGSR